MSAPDLLEAVRADLFQVVHALKAASDRGNPIRFRMGAADQALAVAAPLLERVAAAIRAAEKSGEKMECLQCKGWGMVDVVGRDEQGSAPCPKCGGTGEGKT